MTLSLLLLLASCHGIMDDIYDTPPADVETGEEQLYVDASDWTLWHYIDLNTLSVSTYPIPMGEAEATEPEAEQTGIYTYWYDVFGIGISKRERRSFVATESQPEPDSWHIAIHRNNVRTNGAAVHETALTSMDNLPESSAAYADADFHEDSWNETDVWTVQDKMLQGIIGNQGIKVNTTLSSWLDVQLPPFPPSFTLNNHVFILRFNDGTYAALQLVNYQSNKGVKCCLTINYKYPY